MFWIRRKKPIEQDVIEFGKSRKSYLTTKNHIDHLLRFIKINNINTYEEIDEEQIQTYMLSIKTSVTRESERIQIAQALFLFLRYKKLQLINLKEKRKPGRPEKQERNYAILALRQLKYTYDEIAKHHRLNKRTVYDIVKRIENKE